MGIVVTQDWYLRHGYECPAVAGGSVEIGTARPDTYIPMAPGFARLPTGTVELRDKSTNALLASCSTLAGSVLGGVSAACRVNVTPPELQPHILIRVYTLGPSLASY